MKPAERYILSQPEPYREILLTVQAIIEGTLQDLELQYKWNIPFYYYKKKPFCYLNASHKKRFVDVAFMKGFELPVFQEYLTADGGRSMVKSLRYRSQEDIEVEVLATLLRSQRDLFV